MPSTDIFEASKEGVRIPLSLSEMREGFDNKKQICRVVDVAFNSEVAKGSQTSDDYRTMLIGIVFSRIAEKYNHELMDNYKFPKMKYKETEKGVRLMRLRAKKDS